MRKNALVLILAALPFTSCKCRNGLNGTDGSLVASPSPVAFGPQAQGSKKTIQVVITNEGDAPVNITALPAISGTSSQFFTASYAGDGGTTAATFQPIFLDVGTTTNMSVTYAPTGEETDSATMTIQNDSPAALVVPLSGSGKDPCFQIVCDAGLPGIGANVGGCYGTCDESTGKCAYNGPCSDQALCLSNGTCDPSTGVCQGTSDCEAPGAGTCNGNRLTGDIAPGTCDQGTGKCLYNMSTKICDCACVQDGVNASCAYQWAPVSGLPTGQASSVWSAGTTAGDVWLSVINGVTSGINPNAVYQQVNGAWNQVGTVANAFSALCDGPGCGLALAGSSDSDVYGVTDCTTVQGGECTAGGAWHYNGTAPADEIFLAPTPSYSGLPLTTLLDINGVGFAINNDLSAGPELVSNTSGTWQVVFPTEWHCADAAGSLWGTAANDIWIGWGCNGSNPGQLAHYNGTGLDTGAFALPANEYAAGMWGTSDSDIWAVGTHRWHYDGTSWTVDAVPPPAGAADQTVWGNGTDYFAGGGYIALSHWTSGTDWQLECIAPGYGDPSVYSFTSDGTNFYATTSATSGPGLVERCPGGVCP